MKNTKMLKIFLLVALLTNAQYVLAGAPVWKVSKADKHIFIGGTIHVLAQSDYPLPEAFNKTYNESDGLVLEVDLQGTQAPAFQQQVLTAMSYPAGESLYDKLEPDVLEELQAYCQARNIPLDNLAVFRPGMLAITLTLIELQSLGLMDTGVDQYFNLRAINEGKHLDFLETPEQQLAFLAAMGQGKESELIRYTLMDLANLSEMMSDMKLAWRTGDLDLIYQMASVPMREKMPEIYEQLIVQRNKDWMPRINELFANEESNLLLVGALHLAGDDGLISLLKNQGYTIEQLD